MAADLPAGAPASALLPFSTIIWRAVVRASLWLGLTTRERGTNDAPPNKSGAHQIYFSVEQPTASPSTVLRQLVDGPGHGDSYLYSVRSGPLLPGGTKSHYSSDWDRIPEELSVCGALALRSVMDEEEWDEVGRRCLDALAPAFGLKLCREIYVGPRCRDAFLVASRKEPGVRNVGDVLALLTILMQLDGLRGARVAVYDKDKPIEPGTAWSALRKMYALEFRIQPITESDQRTAGVGDRSAEYEQVIVAVVRAQQTAPRGYVGLKYFAERVLMPGESQERKKLLIDRAVLDGALVLESRLEPGTNAPLKTVAINPDHPTVRRVLALAAGEVPKPLAVKGAALSSTVGGVSRH